MVSGVAGGSSIPYWFLYDLNLFGSLSWVCYPLLPLAHGSPSRYNNPHVAQIVELAAKGRTLAWKCIAATIAWWHA